MRHWCSERSMNSLALPPLSMAVLGADCCFERQDIAAAQGFDGCGIDASILAPMLRRRTSIATKMAITALDRACKEADIGTDLPVVFTSSVGEMAVTDRLCKAISECRFPLSPTQFHNSVHNTAAGYWSLTVDSMAPMQSMAGMQDSFAMGLLEAYCQLQAGAEHVLLVSYDESMPDGLLPDYQWQACSTAWVLGASDTGGPRLSRPYPTTPDRILNHVSGHEFSDANPTQHSIALLKAMSGKLNRQTLQISGGEMPWLLDMGLC